MCKDLKVTIVTVCYNAAATLEQTMLSVLNQTYPNIEYIVIDGGSTDGTVEIIKKYADRLAYWVSETDKGIYDAMNKGILKATGDYINFMNAGDSLYNNSVIEDIFRERINADKDIVIYGSTVIDYPFGTYIVKPGSVKKLEQEMCVCHQSVLVNRRSISSFDTNLKVDADHKMLLSLYEEFPNGFYLYDGIISNYDGRYGLSSNQLGLGLNETAEVSKIKMTFFRKLRIQLRGFLPNSILKPLCRLYFSFNKRYQRL